MPAPVEVRKPTEEIHHQISSQDFGALINLMDEMELVRITNPNRRKKVFEGGSELTVTWLGRESRKLEVIHIAFYRYPEQLEPTDFFVITRDDSTGELQQRPAIVDWLLNNLISPSYLPPPPELLQTQGSLAR